MKNKLYSMLAMIGLIAYNSAASSCIFLVFEEPEFPN